MATTMEQRFQVRSPERTGKAATVDADHLQHVATLANAHAAPSDSAMMSVLLSGVTTIPLGNAMPSAVCRAVPG